MLLGNEAKGQCAFEGDLVIADLDTTSIPIFVSGAENNNLATNNCLETITIHFKHQFIGDVIMELISPAGQKLTFVGPSTTISPSTSLVTGWDVQFFADNLTAVPDPGYDPVWDNLQTWLGFTTYVGKYYPYMGALEDFNMGPVNGVWTLNIIDQVQFGDGHLYCFDLSFCNGGITETCELVEHTLISDPIEECQGSEDLILDITPELSQEFDAQTYNYSYLLFKSNEFQSILADQDLSNLTPGNYSMCGILHRIEDMPTLNGIVVGWSSEEIESFLAEEELCASFSPDCVDIIVVPSPMVIEEKRAICAGDSIVINGVSYTETGVYDIVYPQEPCDSISILDLTVFDLEISIVPSEDSLSCDVPIMMLDASMSFVPNSAAIMWETDDGNITTRPDSLIIVVDQAGTYTFEISGGDCIFSEEITIAEKEDFIEIDINTNILTCLQDSSFIDLTVSDELDTIYWTGPSEFSTLNEDIRVGAEGIYTVNFTTIHGCEVEREVEVFADKVFPELTINGDNLSCTQPEVTLFSSPADTLGSTFQWYNENEALSMDTFLVVQDPGEYALEVTTAKGCVDTFYYHVSTTVQMLEVELVNDTIDCDNSTVNLAYISDIPNLDVLWELPNGDFVIDSTFGSNQVGTYNLTVNDELGCSLDTFLTVVIDSMLPEVTIQPAAFFCGDDSIQLSAQVNFDDLSYTWFKPDGTTDFNESPFIFSPGTYILEACRPNGCCVNDTTEVGVDNTVPFLSFEFEDLSCKNDTIFITPSDTTSFLMEWSFNDQIINSPSSVIQVTEPGIYEVDVTDESNGCKSKYAFNVGIDTFNLIEGLEANVITCLDEEVQILVSSTRDFETFLWTGPGVVDGDIETFVNAPGTYILEYTFTNGCPGMDSILVEDNREFPNLQGEDSEISCDDEFVTLNVEHAASNISISWSGPNNFTGTGTSVEASDLGTYTISAIASGSCVDTLEIELVGDTITPIITIAHDGEITCSDSIVLITATIDSDTEFYSLSGPDVSDPDALIFEVETPGIYTIEATGFNGCTTSRNIEVQQSTDFPEYSIQLDSLTCDLENVTVGISSTDPNLNIVWDGPLSIDDDEYQFSTGLAGNYLFTVTNSNGCALEDSLLVVMDTLAPDNDIILDSHINCLMDSVTLSITDFTNDLQVAWNGPGVSNNSSEELMVGEGGEFTLSLTAPNGCNTIRQIVVEYDTMSPDITILGDPINCSAGKTFLRVESDQELISFDWTGPIDFESTDAEPLIFNQGTYYVEVVGINGCMTLDSILVEDEREFPELEIENFFLPCDDAPVEVYTELLSDDAFVRWFGPNEFFAEEDTILVLEPGEYIGIAINDEGCTKSDTFQVIDEPVLPEFSALADTLLCFGSVGISALEVEDDRSLLWTGPNNYLSEQNPALVEETGHISTHRDW